MSDTAVIEYSLGRFEPLLGQCFAIEDARGNLSVTLVEATNLREAVQRQVGRVR